MIKITGNESDLIIEMLDFISDMPTSFEPLQERMESKYGLDEAEFYLLKNKLIEKIKI
jgi:hypothetical protein